MNFLDNDNDDMKKPTKWAHTSGLLMQFMKLDMLHTCVVC